MKLKTFLCLCLFSTALLGQTPEAWVRQTDLTTGQIYDTPITGSGGAYTAPMQVSASGSLFELFARGTAWDSNIYLLDTKIIGTYNPQVAVSIISEDDYVRGDPAGSTFVKRTRADRPFSVNIQVQGLVADSSDPSEHDVYLGVQGKNYVPATYSSLNQPQYLIEESNLENGTYTFGPIYHQLTSPTLSSGNGEQTFTIVRYASYQVPDTIIAQPKVEVWPVASASVSNITAGQVFIDRIPSLVVSLSDLYPDSRTYVQVYKGNQVLGTSGTLVNGTELRFGAYYNPDQAASSTNVPQSLSVSVDDLSNYASEDGTYTLEIVTHTPFFGRTAERLYHITFEVDRVITSRGQISTMELSSPASP
ncbi:hypothetical protein [Prosthecobacter sp.]|uniref:hypothetical protein n=1 Tax=Prosthecobacter sp. TaxID=1965333 RepID=UPI002487D2BB|nr:hypothetical protein [Prosthecobacter sp.]MDI1311374.1 hypothetical protein [Prosthecobacter sp.]